MKLSIFLLFFSFCLISNIFGEVANDQYEDIDWSKVFPEPIDSSYYKKLDAELLELSKNSNPLDFMLPGTRQAIPASYKLPLNPVRHQLRCSTCWAFSAVCTLETALRQQMGIVKELSEQHLLNCVNETFVCTEFENAVKALEYVRGPNNYALERQILPYIGKKRNCVKSWAEAFRLRYSYTIHAVNLIPNNNQIKYWIMTKGAAIVWIAPDALHGYYRFDPQSFRPTLYSDKYHHNMNLVGWNCTDPNDCYWILRDSFHDKHFRYGYLHVNMNYAHILIRPVIIFVDNMEEREPGTTTPPNTQTTIPTISTESTTVTDVFWDPNFPIEDYTTSEYVSSSPTPTTSETTTTTEYTTTSEYTTSPVITTPDPCSLAEEYIEYEVTAKGMPNSQIVYLHHNGSRIKIKIVVLPCVAKQPTLPEDDNTDVIKVYISGLDGPQDIIVDEMLNIKLQLIPMSLTIPEKNACQVVDSDLNGYNLTFSVMLKKL